MRHRLTRLAIGVTLVVVLGSAQTWAIPAWARKYGTSCQTCHVAYPKLNAFGNAFRLLGYRMPGETEEMVKQPDVPLGSEGYKKVWPKAVWPGAVPSTPPISLSTNFLVRNSSLIETEDDPATPAVDEEEREMVHNDFIFPSDIELIFGGAIGDHISYFGEIAFEREVEDGEVHGDVGIEHADLRFIAPIAGSAAFNSKLGAYQPEFVSVFDHGRRLTVANYDSMYGVQTIHPGGAKEVGGGHHGGGGAIALPSVAVGLEFYGMPWHRLLWSAGVANGLGPGHDTFDANSAKDYYASVGYKWGGLAPDGSNAQEYAGSPKNWRENSFQIDVFGYRGNGERILNELMEAGMIEAFVEDTEYTRYGFDFNWLIQDINVFGAYQKGEDQLLVFENDPLNPGNPGALDPAESGTFDYTSWFVEVDAVLGVPWLIGAVRYETVDLPHEEGGVELEDWERATAHLTGLIRANVKAILEYSWDLNETRNYNAWLGFGIVF